MNPSVNESFAVTHTRFPIRHSMVRPDESNQGDLDEM
jgi:hypothetical protein